MNLDAIFLIGPQGSGKGTQGKLLAEKHGMFYWEMGKIFRDITQEDTPLGRELKDLVNRGVLLSDEIIMQVFKERFASIPQDQAVIFDGVPRRVGQAQFVLDALLENGRTKFVTLFVDLPREESLNRLLLRAEKEGRKDDTRDAIEYRLQQYEQDTLPVLDFLKLHSDFIEIDGRPPIEEVTAEVDQALKKYVQS